MMLRCNYAAEVVDGVICLEDLGAAVSVREDAQAVVDSLPPRGFSPGFEPLIFLERETRAWHSIEVVNGHVMLVAPVGANDPADRSDCIAVVREAWAPAGNPLAAMLGIPPDEQRMVRSED